MFFFSTLTWNIRPYEKTRCIFLPDLQPYCSCCSVPEIIFVIFFLFHMVVRFFFCVILWKRVYKQQQENDQYQRHDYTKAHLKWVCDDVTHRFKLLYIPHSSYFTIRKLKKRWVCESIVTQLNSVPCVATSQLFNMRLYSSIAMYVGSEILSKTKKKK